MPADIEETWTPVYLSPEVQSQHIPENCGQPAHPAAWQNDRVNQNSLDFYKGTLDTVSQAWIRPNYQGYVPFQNHASACLRDIITQKVKLDDGLRQIDEAYQNSKPLLRTQSTVLSASVRQ